MDFTFMNKEKIYEKAEKVGDKLSLSQDLCSCSGIITMIGTMQVCVENYKGLLEYTSELIVLEGIRVKITIHGKRLTIRDYDDENCMIYGKIHSVSFDSIVED
ncbi:MAG: sporulation protein [Lachnospiraceae bacterium]|nr:sporulation protein [Lachnospiraceae bacterium]